MKSFSDFGIKIPYGRTRGQIKTTCPHCKNSRSHPEDKSLSVDLDNGVWLCHHCGWSGSLNHKEAWEKMNYHDTDIRHKTHKVYQKPKPRQTPPLEARALKWFKDVRGISEETLVKMKITEGPEWMPQKKKQCNTIQFNYFKDGELVNTKFRTGDKCFKFTSGCEVLPYNIDAIKGEKECIITEGEMDTLSFVEIGHNNCISVPAGGSNTNLDWLDDYMEGYFDDKETIYIASDTDTVGVHLKNELIRRFGPERCKVLDYGLDCKDANEALVKHGKDFLESCLKNAQDVKVDGVFTVKDFEQDLDALFENGLQKGMTLGFDNFDELCSFETKRLCIVTGVPGCLTGDTLVTMGDGSQKRISDVVVGDVVQSVNLDFSITSNKVRTKWDSGNKDCYIISTQDGHRIIATDEHRFLTSDGWKQLKSIEQGDFVAVTQFKSCEWREVRAIEHIGIRHTYDIEVENTHNFIANGMITHNSGKSEFIDQIAERLNIRYGLRFAYFSPENFPLQYHAAKLIEKFTGKKFGADAKFPLSPSEYKEAKEHLDSDFSFIAPSDFKLDTILEKARYLVRKRGIKCVVIDPYNRLEDEQGSMSETRYISRLLDKMQNFAQQNDVLMILMAHPTKMPRDKEGKTMVPTLYDISGSANFYNKADYGLIVNRDKVKEHTEVIVQKVKFRHLGHSGSAFFKYNLINGRYVPCSEGGGEEIRWDNSNHLTEKRHKAEANSQMSINFGDANDAGAVNPEDDPLGASSDLPNVSDDVPF